MGYGYLEMNLMRTVLALYWPEYFEPRAWALNWRSEKAQSAAKNASDTHKSYDFMNIARCSILFDFVSGFLQSKSALTPAAFDEFSKFREGSGHMNIRSTFHFVKNVLQPLFLV